MDSINIIYSRRVSWCFFFFFLVAGEHHPPQTSVILTKIRRGEAKQLQRTQIRRLWDTSPKSSSIIYCSISCKVEHLNKTEGGVSSLIIRSNLTNQGRDITGGTQDPIIVHTGSLVSLSGTLSRDTLDKAENLKNPEEAVSDSDGVMAVTVRPEYNGLILERAKRPLLYKASNREFVDKPDMIRLLRQHLQGEGLVRIFSTRREWRLLLAEPRSVLHVERLSFPSCSPPLLVCRLSGVFLYDPSVTLIHPLKKVNYIIESPPIFYPTKLCSLYGWLLEQEFIFQLYFVNLLTHQKIVVASSPLPFLTISSKLRCATFSDPPTSPACKIFFMAITYTRDCNKEFTTPVSARVWLHKQENGWRNREVPSLEHASHAIFLDDSVYVVREDGTLVWVFDCQALTYRAVTFDVGRALTQAILVVYESRVLLATLTKEGMEISRLEFATDVGSMEKIERLPRVDLFLSCYGSVAVSCETGNKVFLPTLMEGNVVFYSMISRQFHSLDISVVHKELLPFEDYYWFHEGTVST